MSKGDSLGALIIYLVNIPLTLLLGVQIPFDFMDVCVKCI